MQPIIALMRRDLRKYFRSPVLMVVSLFLPLLQLVIIGHAFGGQIRNVSIALVSLDRGPEAVRVQQAFRAIEENASTFRVTLEHDLDTALDAAHNGVVAAAIVIPEDYSRRVHQEREPRLGLVLDNTDPFVVGALTAKMTELVNAVNQPDVSPRYLRQVALEVVELYPYIEYIEYLLPGAITLAIFVCSLIGGGLLYIDDKARGFHEGYLVTPISRSQRVFGLIASGTVKATIAGMVVTMLGAVIAGVARDLTPGTILLLLGINTLVALSLISMIAFMMVRVSDPVVPRAMFGILNTLLFFPSGAMYPISSFPPWLQAVAAVDPFAYAVHAFRAALLKHVGPAALMSDIGFLAAFSGICVVGTVLLFRRRL
jgi:ABC-2 type transport system permease protein